MAIKNYTTKIPANRSIQEIQYSLVNHGSICFALGYEQGTGRIQSLQFILKIEENQIPFHLPVDWRAFQRILKQDRIKRWDDEDYCYWVAWRNLRDWVLAQMALYETQMVTLPQIFLPYAADSKGKTAFQYFAENPKLLLN